jgi:hypothetical protein
VLVLVPVLVPVLVLVLFLPGQDGSNCPPPSANVRWHWLRRRRDRLEFSLCCRPFDSVPFVIQPPAMAAQDSLSRQSNTHSYKGEVSVVPRD